MKENNYKTEEIPPKKEGKQNNSRFSKAGKKGSKSVAQIMNGDFLTRDFMINNLGYIFFVIFLMILLVSKGYYVHQLRRNIKKEEKAVRNINADYVETKAKLEARTRRDVLIKRLKPLGLIETTNPVKVIRIEKEQK